MERPSAEIEGCRAAHARLSTYVEDFDDAAARQLSGLPGWTKGHVLTHLARNAESMVRRLEALASGGEVDQHEGGAEGRARQIEAGARRLGAELIADVLSWSGALDDAFAVLADDCWRREVRTVGSTKVPVAALPFRRWREVEVHLVDLNVGFELTDLSQGLVDRALPRAVAQLEQRTDQRAVLGWLLGRASPPPLDPWG